MMSTTQYEMGDDIARGIVDYDRDEDELENDEDDWDYPENWG